MKGVIPEALEIFNTVLEHKNKLKEAEIQQIEDQIKKINERKQVNLQKV